MIETKLTSALKTNSEEPKSPEQHPTKDAYRAPRLVVIGTAVELVQGLTYGYYNDFRQRSIVRIV